MEFYVTLAPGLEEVSAKELKALGCEILELRRDKGRIFIRGKENHIAELNYFARTIERVILLLLREKIGSLDEIYKFTKKIDFTQWIKPKQSFAVRAKRVGEHDFTSIDIAKVVGQAVIDSYRESTNVRLKVNLTQPEVIVRAEVVFDELLIGLDLTGDEALHKRGYRIYQHPAPLNPSIASSLVILSNWSAEKSLLDPMCGSGTILIEAALLGRNIPPGEFRNSYAFTKIFGDEILEEAKSKVEEKNVKLELYGLEKFKKHVNGAMKNAEKAKVSDTITFLKGDATKLEKIFNKSFDVVIVNPPYGLRIARKGIIRKLYNNFLRSLKKIIHAKTEIIVITAEDKVFKEFASADYTIKNEIKVKYGNLDAKIFMLSLYQRYSGDYQNSPYQAIERERLSKY